MVNENARILLKTKQLIVQGELKEALTILNSFLSENESSYDAIVLSGLAWSKMNEFDKAKDFYCKAYAINSSKDPAIEGLINLYHSNLENHTENLLPLLLQILPKFDRTSPKFIKYAEIANEVSGILKINEYYETSLDRISAYLSSEEIIEMWTISMYRIKKLISDNLASLSMKSFLLEMWLRIYSDKLTVYSTPFDVIEKYAVSVAITMKSLLPELQMAGKCTNELEALCERTANKIFGLNHLQSMNVMNFCLTFRVERLLGQFFTNQLNLSEELNHFQESPEDLIVDLNLIHKNPSISLAFEFLNKNVLSITKNALKSSENHILTCSVMFLQQNYAETMIYLSRDDQSFVEKCLTNKFRRIVIAYKRYLMIKSLELMDQHDELPSLIKETAKWPFPFFKFTHLLSRIDNWDGSLTEEMLQTESNSLPELHRKYLIAKFYFIQNDFESAGKICHDALDKIDSHSNLYFSFHLLNALIWKARGDGNESKASLLNCIKIEPSRPEPYYEISLLDANERNWTTAKVNLLKCHKFGMKCQKLFEHLFKVCTELEDWVLLRNLFEQEIDNCRKNEQLRKWLLFKLSYVCIQLDDSNSSILCLQKYFSLQPSDSIGWILLGDAYLSKKCHSAALVAYNHALEDISLDSLHQSHCILGISNAYMLEGDIKRSQEASSRALEIHPNDPVVLYKCAKNFLQYYRITLQNRFYRRAEEFLLMACSYSIRVCQKLTGSAACSELLLHCLLECMEWGISPNAEDFSILVKIFPVETESQILGLVLYALNISQSLVKSHPCSHCYHLLARTLLKCAIIRGRSKSRALQMDSVNECIQAFITSISFSDSDPEILVDLACALAIFDTDHDLVLRILSLSLQFEIPSGYHNISVLFYGSNMSECGKVFLLRALHETPKIYQTWALKGIFYDTGNVIEKWLSLTHSLTLHPNEPALVHLGYSLCMEILKIQEAYRLSHTSGILKSDSQRLAVMFCDISSYVDWQPEMKKNVQIYRLFVKLYLEDFSFVRELITMIPLCWNHLSSDMKEFYGTLATAAVIKSRVCVELPRELSECENVRSRIFYAFCLISCDRISDANSEFNKILQSKDIKIEEKINCLLGISISAFHSNQPTKICEALFQKCLQLAPKNLECYMLYAAFCLKHGNLKHAEVLISELLKIMKTLEENAEFRIVYLKVILHLRKNEMFLAKSTLIQFVHRYPLHIEAWTLFLTIFITYEPENYSVIKSLIKRVVGPNSLQQTCPKLSFYYFLYFHSDALSQPHTNLEIKLLHAQPYSSIPRIASLFRFLSEKIYVSSSSTLEVCRSFKNNTDETSKWLSELFDLLSDKLNSLETCSQDELITRMTSLKICEDSSKVIDDISNESTITRFYKLMYLGCQFQHNGLMQSAYECLQNCMELAKTLPVKSFYEAALRRLLHLISTCPSFCSKYKEFVDISFTELLNHHPRDPVLLLSLYNFYINGSFEKSSSHKKKVFSLIDDLTQLTPVIDQSSIDFCVSRLKRRV